MTKCSLKKEREKERSHRVIPTAVTVCLSHPLLYLLQSLCFVCSRPPIGLHNHNNNLLIGLFRCDQPHIEVISISLCESGSTKEPLSSKRLSKQLCLLLQP